MKRLNLFIIVILMLIFIVSGCNSQKTGEKTSPQLKATLKTTPMKSEEAFKILYDINEQKNLIAPFGFPPNEEKFYYTGLKSENCFGFVLVNKLHIVGESSGEIYGAVRSGDQEMIGFLYSEVDFAIDKNTYKKGSYAVFVSPNVLVIASGLTAIAEKIPLKTAIDKSFFQQNGKRPRFSLNQINQSLSINIEGNSFSMNFK